MKRVLFNNKITTPFLLDQKGAKNQDQVMPSTLLTQNKRTVRQPGIRKQSLFFRNNIESNVTYLLTLTIIVFL